MQIPQFPLVLIFANRQQRKDHPFASLIKYNKPHPMPPKRQPQKPSQDFGSETPYLINTGKAVHGHKLKMRDLMKIQQLKGRRCSPSKTEREIMVEMEEPRVTEYSEKYRGFETVEDEEALYRFLSVQRERNSRQASTRMKLFTQREVRTAREDRSSTYRTISTHRDTHTSQTHRAASSQRTPATPIKHYTTISYENSPAMQDPSPPYLGIEFTSDNLGKRMNEYMNLVLQKKQKGELQIRDEQLKEQALLMRMRESQAQRNLLTQHKRKSNNFFRQMKKHLKQQYSRRSEEPAIREKVLVKSLVQRAQDGMVERRQAKFTSQTAHFRTLDARPHPSHKKDIPRPSYTQREHLYKTLQEIICIPSSQR